VAAPPLTYVRTLFHFLFNKVFGWCVPFVLLLVERDRITTGQISGSIPATVEVITVEGRVSINPETLEHPSSQPIQAGRTHSS